MATFKVFFNAWAGGTVQVSFKGTSCVPANIWQDFKTAGERGLSIEETLLYKAVKPDTPAPNKRNPNNMTFTIEGEGIAPNYLANTQTPGSPYEKRFPDQVEQAFKHWFKTMCHEKYLKTQKK